jgi:hypothetical protein
MVQSEALKTFVRGVKLFLDEKDNVCVQLDDAMSEDRLVWLKYLYNCTQACAHKCSRYLKGKGALSCSGLNFFNNTAILTGVSGYTEKEWRKSIGETPCMKVGVRDEGNNPR